MNYCFFIGRLTKDVSEVKKTQNGHSMCHFTMAINNGRDKNGNELPPDFPQITLFGNLADVCARCLRKGSLVAVVGKYKTASKKNADGSMSYYNNIQADEVKFLEPKDKNGSPAPQQMPQQQYQMPQQQMPQQQYQQPQQPQQQYQQSQQQMPQQQYQQMQPNGVPQGFTPADEDFSFDPNLL